MCAFLRLFIKTGGFMNMTKLITLVTLSSTAVAGAYVDFSAGGLYRQLEGDSRNYEAAPSFATEISIGYKWENWDLAIDTNYSIARQKDFAFSYGSVELKDDFNWHSLSAGPTLKYHINSQSGSWSWAPFVGAHFNVTALDNSKKLTDQTTGEKEDFGQETWGYGGKLGVEFKNYTPKSQWLEAVNYKIYASYTKYRETEGDYSDGSRLVEYNGDTPDNLYDYSAGVLVGFSLGDKLFKKTKSLIGL